MDIVRARKVQLNCLYLVVLGQLVSLKDDQDSRSIIQAKSLKMAFHMCYM